MTKRKTTKTKTKTTKKTKSTIKTKSRATPGEAPQARKRLEIRKVAREKLGFATLRPGQEEAVTSLLLHRDTLVVQPTGSGKSAIYRIAGLMMKGLTVVVSPLIALQKDQVDAISEDNIFRIRPESTSDSSSDAVVVNSTQRIVEARQVLQRVQESDVEYVFLAPEQLRKESTMEKLKASGVSLFVVDEAHCISHWGHDFRPDYLEIGTAIQRLGHPTVLAMTATAAPDVRHEIVERLGLRKPSILVQSFDRPNIYLRVDKYGSENEKMDALLRRVAFSSKPGIIYAATRRNTEEIAEALEQQGGSAVIYHGGLKASDRAMIQEQFMNGETDVIAATNAFGMGVDKPDVRFVYHFDAPDSLDAYYQEIGRSGRDGKRAEAVLFYRPENLGSMRGRLPEIPEDVSDRAEYAEKKRERLEQMRAYANAKSCRREFLLRYFGEEFTGPCYNCDNCEAAQRVPVTDFSAGTRREVA